MPRYDLIWQFDQRSMVRWMVSAFDSFSNTFFLTAEYFFFSNTLDNCFLLGTWYIGSSVSTNFLNLVLSTTARGMRSSATKSTRASLAWTCFRFFESYFFWSLTRWFSVCCDAASSFFSFNFNGWMRLYNNKMTKICETVIYKYIWFLPGVSTN